METVGMVSWASGESRSFTESAKYIAEVKEEIEYMATSGFRYKTLTNDPATRKAIDDIVYNLMGEKNPHNIEHYSDKTAVSFELDEDINQSEINLSSDEAEIFQMITPEQAHILIEEHAQKTTRPFGKYLMSENDMWIAIDDSNHDCFVEEFTNRKDAAAWLKGEFEVCDSMEPEQDINYSNETRPQKGGIRERIGNAIKKHRDITEKIVPQDFKGKKVAKEETR